MSTGSRWIYLLRAIYLLRGDSRGPENVLSRGLLPPHGRFLGVGLDLLREEIGGDSR